MKVLQILNSYNGKGSKKKNSFENKACQLNYNENIYSENCINQRESNSNDKVTSKYSKQMEISIKNKDISKTYRSLEEKYKNEFKYDHVYNHKNIKMNLNIIMFIIIKILKIK